MILQRRPGFVNMQLEGRRRQGNVFKTEQHEELGCDYLLPSPKKILS
jgi:hypothetical protein